MNYVFAIFMNRIASISEATLSILAACSMGRQEAGHFHSSHSKHLALHLNWSKVPHPAEVLHSPNTHLIMCSQCLSSSYAQKKKEKKQCQDLVSRPTFMFFTCVLFQFFLGRKNTSILIFLHYYTTLFI